MKKEVTLAQTISQECIVVRLRIINRVITRLYDEGLRRYGIKISQANILVVVANSGEAKPAYVCRILHMEKSTLSRNVERMHKNGWLKMERLRDGRSHTLKITPKGLKLIKFIHPAWEAAQKKAEDILGAKGVSVVFSVTNSLWSGKAAA